MSSNLPPGVTDGMIPGNRAEDADWETFHEVIDKEVEAYGLSIQDAIRIWVLGVHTWRQIYPL